MSGPAPTLIRIEYRVRFGELLKASLLAWYRPYLWMLVFVSIIPVCCTAMVPFSSAGKELPLPAYLWLLSVPLLIWVVGPGLLFLAALRHWNRVQQAREPHEWEFTDWGYTVRQLSASSTAAWSTLSRAETVSRMVLLTNVAGQTFFIPTRAFPTPGLLLDFKALVKSNLPNTARL